MRHLIIRSVLRRAFIILGCLGLSLVLAGWGGVGLAQSIGFLPGAPSVYEAGGASGTNISIIVTRNPATNVATVDFQTGNGSAFFPTDYSPTNGTLTFAVGEVFKVITIPIVDDLVAEVTETFTVTLLNATGGTLTNETTTVTVFDDDTVFSFSTALYVVREDGTNVAIVITRSPSSIDDGPASVVFSTMNGAGTNNGAVTPFDFSGFSTNVVFTNGQANFTLLVPIVNDCDVESNETFFVNLESPIGSKLGVLTNATVRITDDDTAAGQVQFTILGPTIRLENSPLQPVSVRVSRLCGTNGQITVDFEMFNDVNTSPAFLCNGDTNAYWSGPRNDYTFANSVVFGNGLPGGTLTWANGDDNDKIINITFINDDLVEMDESILIRLVRPTGGATIGVRRRSEVIILNDDLASGVCDPDYNTLAILNPTPGANSTVYAAATYQDGTERTVIGGDFSAVNAIVRNGVARILADGLVDAAFDPGAGADGFVSSLLVLTNGQVLVGGGFTSMDNISRNGIARLNADGSLDAAFDVGAGVNGAVQAMALQADGKVIIAGSFTTFNNVPRQNVARLNTDGSLDADFDVAAGPNDVVYAVAVQADGLVLIGGAFTMVNGIDNFMVARLGTNGSVDTAWTPVSGADNTVYAIKLQPDGKALIGGAFTSYDGEMRQSIARLETSGLVDATFNACRGMNGPVYAIALQTNDQVLIGGDFTVYNDTPRANYARLLTDGALDTAFLDNYYNQAQPGSDAFVAAVSVQVDGNIILGGGFSAIGGGALRPSSYSNPQIVQTRFNYARVMGGVTLTNVPAPLVGSYVNAPGNLQFVQPAYTIDENVLGGSLPITLERVNGTLSGVSVQYRTVDGSARAGVDYTSVSGTASWADCDDGQLIFPIPILDNPSVDGNKTFFIELSLPVSFGPLQTNQPALGFNCRAEVTIVDNDKNYGVLGFSKTIYSTSEGSSSATVTVTRTNGSTGLVRAQFSTFNGSATSPADYRTTNGTVTFTAGQTSQTFTIPIINDIASESEEFVGLRLFSPTGGATLGLTNASLLIFDNEASSPGSLSFTAEDFTVNEGAGTATITIRRTSGSVGTIAATFFTSDLPPGPGAARFGVDYTGQTNVVTFPPGVTNRSVTIPINGDGLVEGTERLSLSLISQTGGGALGFLTNASLTLLDDDAYGRLGFAAGSYYFNEASGLATIAILRTEGSAEEVSVDFMMTGDTAIDGADYTGTNGTLTFGPGALSQTIFVPLANDGDLEGNELVLLTLTNFSKAGAGVFTNALLTLVDDEALDVPAGAVDTFFDPRPGPNQFVNTVALQTDGRLLAGGTFTAFGGLGRARLARLGLDGSVDATFDPGAGANDTVNTVLVQPDGKVLVGGAFTRMGNRNRGHIARLTSSGALDTSFNPGAGADNPVNALVLLADGRIYLGGGFATYNGATRNGVARLTPNGVLDSSFAPGTGADGTVNALAVQADGRLLVGGEFSTFHSRPLPYLVRLNEDGSLDETFSSASPLNGSVRSIVVQPDGRILVGGGFTSVGAESRPYVARLNEDGTLDATFDPGAGPNSLVYAIALQADGKVLIGGEFTAVGALTQNRLARLTAAGAVDTTIDFGSGANLFVATVLVQPDEEIVIGGGFTTINGLDRPYIARLVGGEDVGPGTIFFNQPNYAINEHFTNVTVTVVRAGGSQGQVEVEVVSTDLTATGDEDYGRVQQTLTFLEGETFKTLVIGITNDSLVEASETFLLALTNVTGGALLNEGAVTTVTILNDDSVVGFAQATYGVNEKVVGTNAIITVRRAGATNGTVSVNYATVAGGDAVTNRDYAVVQGVLTFAAGQTEGSFFVPIFNDQIVEGNETVSLLLSNETGGAVITNATATLIIIDDEFSPGQITFSAAGYTAPEGQSPLVITFLRTNGVTGAATVDWSTTPGTATAGVDYAALGGVVSFADGDGLKTVEIIISDDALVEGNETFTISIGNPTGGAVISGPATVTVTVEDDEFGPGSLDPAFDPGAGADNYVRAVAVGPDGSIAVGGAFANFDGTNRAHVARLRPTGGLDLGFNPGGGANALVSAVGVQGDGKMIIAGAFSMVDSVTLNRVARFSTNGSVDTAFSQPSGLNSAVNALALAGSAAVTVAGGFTLPTPGVVRYRADGSVDTTFDPGTSLNGQVQAVFVQTNGQMLLGGAFTRVAGFPRYKLARLHADGLLDQTFNPVTNNGVVFAVAAQADGKVIIGGAFTTVGTSGRARIARLHQDGSLDTSFAPGAGANGVVNALVVQPDGRIVIAGDFTSYNGTNRNRYARLNANGSLDLSFDPGRGADGTVYALALLPDGKLILGGDFQEVNGFVRRGVARVNGDPPPFAFGSASLNESLQPVFTVNTVPGSTYVTEVSEDLVTWSELSTTVATGFTMTITETNPTFQNQRFYRVRLVEP